MKFGSDLVFESQNEKDFFLTKWNWSYPECNAFQEKLVEQVKLHPEQSFYLFCHHDPVLTMGKGLRETSQNPEKLIPTDQAILANVGLPLYAIHRGGGVTFHNPGQFIFYVIKKISANHYTLNDHICWMQKVVIKAVYEMTGLVLTAKKNPLGLWHGPHKVGSIGVGIKKWITMHGLALNLTLEESTKKMLMTIYPCGLQPTLYAGLCELGYKVDANSLAIKTRSIIESDAEVKNCDT
jgi:lipoate-protein ligase B